MSTIQWNPSEWTINVTVDGMSVRLTEANAELVADQVIQAGTDSQVIYMSAAGAAGAKQSKLSGAEITEMNSHTDPGAFITMVNERRQLAALNGNNVPTDNPTESGAIHGYFPRACGSGTDLDLVVGALRAKQRVMVVGEPGSGKTSVFKAAAKVLDVPCTVVAFNEGSTIAGMIGGYRPGSTEPQPGQVRLALEKPGVTICDDFHNAAPELIQWAYQLNNSEGLLPDGMDGWFAPHPEAVLVTTLNTEFFAQVDEPAVDRFPIKLQMESSLATLEQMANAAGDPWKRLVAVIPEENGVPQIAHRTLAESIVLWNTNDNAIRAAALSPFYEFARAEVDNISRIEGLVIPRMSRAPGLSRFISVG